MTMNGGWMMFLQSRQKTIFCVIEMLGMQESRYDPVLGYRVLDLDSRRSSHSHI